jgi:hypothetical protein
LDGVVGVGDTDTNELPVVGAVHTHLNDIISLVFSRTRRFYGGHTR